MRLRAVIPSLLSFLLLVTALPAASSAPDQITSKYSSTKTGVILEQSTDKSEIDFFKKRCPGFGGYDVIFQGADARSWINLKWGNTVVDLMNPTFALAPGQFPNKANDVIEWRGIVHGGKFLPFAIIYRIEGADEATNHAKTRLIVIKLDKAKSSVAGYAQGKDEDAESKRIADKFKSHDP
jgi:hypothetical protein